MVSHIECRTLIPGEVVLRFVFIVDAANYDAQAPRLDKLLSGLSIAGGTPVATQS